MWTELINACFQWGAQSVSYLWLPVLAWSLCCGLALLAGDRFERLRLSYAGLYGLLLMLPLGIVLNGLIRLTPSAAPVAQVATTAQVVTQAPLATPAPVLADPTAPWVPVLTTILMVVLVLAAVVALGALLLSVLRALRLLATSWMLPQSVTSAVVPAAVLDEVATQARRLGIQRPIRVEVSNTLTSPHTYGWRSPVLILPAALADRPDELRMACLHELAHIQRHDFALHWLDLFISEVFFFAPLVRRVRARLHLYREQACDRAVLAHSDVSPRRYAQFLLQYVTASNPRPALALTIHAPDSELKQRVRAMKDQSSSRTLTPMQTGLLVALLMASAAALIVAISQALSPNAPQLESEVPVVTEQPLIEEEIPLENDETFVIVEEMPQLIGGLSGLQETIRYPRIAKEAGISGRVFVQFVVSPDGTVRDAVITRGIGAGCDEEALRAIRAAQFIPGKQRGRAVPVKMSLPITFRLNDAEATTGVGEVILEEAKLDISDLAIRVGMGDRPGLSKIDGTVRDARTGQPLAGANIRIINTTIGTVSDRQGRYEISNVPPGVQALVISFVGYVSTRVEFSTSSGADPFARIPADDLDAESLESLAEFIKAQAGAEEAARIMTEAEEILEQVDVAETLEGAGESLAQLLETKLTEEQRKEVLAQYSRTSERATWDAIQSMFDEDKPSLAVALGLTEREAPKPTAKIEIADLKTEIATDFAGNKTQKISGTVRDAATEQILRGAQVIVRDARQGAVTGLEGEFTILNIPVGQHTLQARFIGYQHLTVENVGKTE
ncbi:MAG: TonB family protein [Bacteroidota bacterium]